MKEQLAVCGNCKEIFNASVKGYRLKHSSNVYCTPNCFRAYYKKFYNCNHASLHCDDKTKCCTCNIRDKTIERMKAYSSRPEVKKKRLIYQQHYQERVRQGLHTPKPQRFSCRIPKHIANLSTDALHILAEWTGKTYRKSPQQQQEVKQE